MGERMILNSRKPDLRGRKDADNMIINNTHKIISDMIFIINYETISDIINNTQIMQDMIFTCKNIIRWRVQDG
ncbi:Uncharacterised protein [Escherichia coli]|nr:Uncharacterised protein [Escherichia coli]CAD6085646.1 Uncharacterised protein [Escherichia coli]CAD6148882.1 Uncharacterised protein [Escherichia coli]